MVLDAIAELKDTLQTVEGRLGIAKELKSELQRMGKRDPSYEPLQARMLNNIYIAYERANRNLKQVKTEARKCGITAREVDMAVERYST